MKKNGIGIIGCGGRIHQLIPLLLAKSKSIEVTAICDPDNKAIENSLEKFNPNAVVYDDYKELLEDKSVDWVMIGSWNCFHREHIIASFEAGKNVFCEKPLATTFEDCMAIKKTWKKSGKILSIGFTLRYSPHYRKIKGILDQGLIGDIISMEFNETLEFNHGGFIMSDWRRLTQNSGTHLLEKCCHDIDIANWLVGSLAERVASFGGLNFFVPENVSYIDELPANQEGKKAYCLWPTKENLDPFTSNKDIKDNQVIIIEYLNGVRSTFHTNCNAGIPERRMYICGTKGAIRADVMSGVLEFQPIGYNEVIKDYSTGVSGCHGGGDEVLTTELADLMIKNCEPKASLDEGFKSAITCFAIDQAASTGTVVDMKPLWEKASIPKLTT